MCNICVTLYKEEKKQTLTWISRHSCHLPLPVQPLRRGVFSFHHTGAVLLWGLEAGVWGTWGHRWVWWRGSEVGGLIFRPKGRGLSLCIWVKVALICFTCTKQKNHTLNYKDQVTGRVFGFNPRVKCLTLYWVWSRSCEEGAVAAFHSRAELSGLGHQVLVCLRRLLVSSLWLVHCQSICAPGES